jgi:hypothetical protein
MEEMRIYTKFWTDPEGKRPLRRYMHRLEYNTRMDLRKKGWEGVESMRQAQDKDQWQSLVNMVIKLQVP